MKFDFVVLGGGSAGYAAARTAVDLGLKTAVVDGAEELGGLCILRGCMPSKTLIESANRFRTIRRAEEFGLRAKEPEIRAEEIIARKRRLIADFAEYRQNQLQTGKFELIRGNGRFLSPTEIEVESREGGENRKIEAKTTLIATGSEVSRPDIPGLDAAGYLTSDDILELEKIPESIVVLGGGAIALELAHYLNAIGSRVTLIQRSQHVLSAQDADLARVVEDALRERGMEILTGTQITEVHAADGQKKVHFNHGGEPKTANAQEILLALGRWPRTGGLNLKIAGVETSGRQIRAAETQATSTPNIFAAGDVCGPLEVVHLAIEQGEKAAHNAALHLGKINGREPQKWTTASSFSAFSPTRKSPSSVRARRNCKTPAAASKRPATPSTITANPWSWAKPTASSSSSPIPPPASCSAPPSSVRKPSISSTKSSSPCISAPPLRIWPASRTITRR